MEELIVVKQLPVIEEKLKELSSEIDEKVTRAKSLVVCDDTVKEVKKMRADMNNEFKALETQRKNVKETVLAPYMKFEEVYKIYISDKYKSADIELKQKIDEVETTQKKLKEDNIRTYFEEYSVSKEIDFVEFEQARLNITLSASEKSLREQAKAFLDKIDDDLKLIDSQDYKEEILIEYKVSLNVSQAITTVLDRKKQLEEMQKKFEEEKVQKETEQEMIQEVEQVLTSPAKVEKVEKIELLEIAFKVRGSREELKELVGYLKERGFDYEQLN